MQPKNYRLRAHHLLNFINGYLDNYNKLKDGLMRTKISSKTGERIYSDSDAVFSHNFYNEIASNPENTILLVGGIDQRCEGCSNYNGKACIAFDESNLALEDSRTLNLFFSDLNVGNEIKVSDALKYDTDYIWK